MKDGTIGLLFNGDGWMKSLKCVKILFLNLLGQKDPFKLYDLKSIFLDLESFGFEIFLLKWIKIWIFRIFMFGFIGAMTLTTTFFGSLNGFLKLKLLVGILWKLWGFKDESNDLNFNDWISESCNLDYG